VAPQPIFVSLQSKVFLVRCEPSERRPAGFCWPSFMHAGPCLVAPRRLVRMSSTRCPLPSRPGRRWKRCTPLVLELFSAAEFRVWLRLGPYDAETLAELPGDSAPLAEVVEKMLGSSSGAVGSTPRFSKV
jgi:hypothetical protein